MARKYSCFPFADGMLTFTDGLRPHSRRHPPRRLALRVEFPPYGLAATVALSGLRTKRPILVRFLVCLLVPRAATAFEGWAYGGSVSGLQVSLVVPTATAIMAVRVPGALFVLVSLKFLSLLFTNGILTLRTIYSYPYPYHYFYRCFCRCPYSPFCARSSY
jgi:hypothetical protein